MTRLLNIAVIGAGIAGLSCATALQAAGHSVQVFDKSRGGGGRMSTRRSADETWQCDHGAQYFTARDPAFAAEVARWQQAGVAALWAPRVAVLNDPSLRQPGPLDRFVGTPRMTAPAQWLAGSLKRSLGTTIQRLHREGPHWQIETAEHGRLDSRFDAVLLALPAPQAWPLAEPHAPALAAAAASVRMRGCWALMLQFDSPVDLPFDAAFVNSGPLRWIARDSSKPGRTAANAAPQETWLLHAEAEWSEAHLELPPDEAAALMLAAFAALGGPAPPRWTAHRWRYADTRQPLLDGCLWDVSLRLGLCGDWLNGGKVEGAWLSGQGLAAKLSLSPAVCERSSTAHQHQQELAMNPSFHHFSELFAQLGLATDDDGIRTFIEQHRPLPAGTLLADAAFWTPAQAALLREQKQLDADWAEIVDQLNLALH